MWTHTCCIGVERGTESSRYAGLRAGSLADITGHEENIYRQARRSMVRMCGTTETFFFRMLKKAVQQGRSERRGEAYVSVR
jgi:hypothetical protein